MTKIVFTPGVQTPGALCTVGQVDPRACLETGRQEIYHFPVPGTSPRSSNLCSDTTFSEQPKSTHRSIFNTNKMDCPGINLRVVSN